MDGGYIVGGNAWIWDPVMHDNFFVMGLIKTDGSGNTIWSWYQGYVFSFCNSVLQTSDEAYVLAGYYIDEIQNQTNILIFKTDSSGAVIWGQDYIGGNEGVEDIELTGDGGFIATGYTCSFGSGGSDVLLIKLDSVGTIQWTRAYGGTNNDYGYSVKQTADGGYIVEGRTASFGVGNYDIYMIKTDCNGDSLWTHTYGGINNESGRSVVQTIDGSFIIAGYTNSYGMGSEDFFVVRTDSNGDTLWSGIYGGEESDQAYSVVQTSDGGYAIAGLTCSFGLGLIDFYLVRLESETSFISPKGRWDSVPETNVLHIPYPNPFNTATTISYEVPIRGRVMVNVCDVLGRLVATLADGVVNPGSYSVVWDAKDLPSGIYFVRMQVEGFQKTQKIVLLK